MVELSEIEEWYIDKKLDFDFPDDLHPVQFIIDLPAHLKRWNQGIFGIDHVGHELFVGDGWESIFRIRVPKKRILKNHYCSTHQDIQIRKVHQISKYEAFIELEKAPKTGIRFKIGYQYKRVWF